MISLFVSILVLVLGYSAYGRLVERIFAPSSRPTPAVVLHDGVDYVAMPKWKAFFIQLLNIAGTGPIFGAITGALWGPSVYLWIVFGTLLAGGVHDYFSGMISLRENGLSIPEVIGKHLGNFMRTIMRAFSLILLVLTGVVFMVGPAQLLFALFPDFLSVRFWTIIIMAYYLLAAFLPIDKVIGRFYPVFGLFLVIMAVSIAGGTLLNSGTRPMMEITLKNLYPSGAAGKLPIWPLMFVSVACGAVSGFHSTQSPIISRCLSNEKDGRSVFYGAMVAEGIVALIWASASIAFFWGADGSGTGMALLKEIGGGNSGAVSMICASLLGRVGAVFAILGVVVCPITSGDTAFRGARMIVFDWFRGLLDEKRPLDRFAVAAILLGVGFMVSFMDYQVVWRYFSWSNQTLAAIVLWAASAYIIKSYPDSKRRVWITLLPAMFMTAVCSSYLLYAPECFNLSRIGRAGETASSVIGVVVSASVLALFAVKMNAKR